MARSRVGHKWTVIDLLSYLMIGSVIGHMLPYYWDTPHRGWVVGLLSRHRAGQLPCLDWSTPHPGDQSDLVGWEKAPGGVKPRPVFICYPARTTCCSFPTIDVLFPHRTSQRSSVSRVRQQ